METNSSKYEINVNGSLFDWDLDNATFKFENDEVVVFWVNTAFKTLLDSIEEISGEKSAELVLETAGYRTGKIVSKFYLESNKEKEDIINHLPNMYLTAGWGKQILHPLASKKRRRSFVLKMGGSIRLMWNKKRSRRHFFAWTLGRGAQRPV